MDAVSKSAQEYVKDRKDDDLSKGKGMRVSDYQISEAERALAVAIKRSDISQDTIDKLPADLVKKINEASEDDEVKTHYHMYPFVITGECEPVYNMSNDMNQLAEVANDL